MGKIGFNSASVGTCLNAIRAKPADPSKLPIHLALRVCLDSSSSAAAISKLEALGGIAASAHILIADALGPRGLELSPRGNAYLEPDERGMVYHTNHFLVNKQVTVQPWLAGSPVRLERVRKLAAEVDDLRAPVSADVLRQKIFADRFNSPQAICAQEDPITPVQTRSSTLFCIVMRFVKGGNPRAEVVWGRPGSGEEGPVLEMPW